MLALALGAMASPAEAAPFAYVANEQSNNVSVIDTATNMVVATVAVGGLPDAVAVTRTGNTPMSRVLEVLGTLAPKFR